MCEGKFKQSRDELGTKCRSKFILLRNPGHLVGLYEAIVECTQILWVSLALQFTSATVYHTLLFNISTRTTLTYIYIHILILAELGWWMWRWRWRWRVCYSYSYTKTTWNWNRFWRWRTRTQPKPKSVSTQRTHKSFTKMSFGLSFFTVSVSHCESHQVSLCHYWLHSGIWIFSRFRMFETAKSMAKYQIQCAWKVAMRFAFVIITPRPFRAIPNNPGRTRSCEKYNLPTSLKISRSNKQTMRKSQLTSLVITFPSWI